MQDVLDGVWMNLGVDIARATTPPSLQPGIGLRPGEADHPAARYVPLLYAALYESVAAHSRLGVNVAVDVGHYERSTLAEAAARLQGLPVLFVGVRCPLEVVMERRRAAEPGQYAAAAVGEPIPTPILLWQREVHGDWTYDLELDTSRLTPSECAAAIARRLGDPDALTAFAKLAR
jgi:chloramphenicol 3-O phosphotransferase